MQAMLRNALAALRVSGKKGRTLNPEIVSVDDQHASSSAKPIGLIAGSGAFPLRFVEGAQRHNRPVVAVCFADEAAPELADMVEKSLWLKVGELGRLIDFFSEAGVSEVAMAGGVNRIRLFGGVKLDARGAALLLRLRSTKDDVVMRGVAEELAKEGIEVVSSVLFLRDCLVSDGVLTKSLPTAEEWSDIQVGKAALAAMSSQDIGQLVVVREGLIVAVEAVEGSDAAILRGGSLGGNGSVVVKFAKSTQDMRFDVPTVGARTIETMIKAGARVLALESGRCLMMDREEMIALADRHKISVVGCAPLVDTTAP